jgi:hypothetical protein
MNIYNLFKTCEFIRSKKVLTILFFPLPFLADAQVTFDKGYFIDNNGQRVECLIKNKDWAFNPIDFEYKLSESEATKLVTISDVKEFSLYNTSKYIRANVKIDMSGTQIQNLSKQVAPEWEENTVFLKLLVEGTANLYYWVKGEKPRFFYSLKDSTIEQLVYKAFITKTDKTGENRQYISQLHMMVNCQGLELSKIQSSVNYKIQDLTSYFQENNACAKGEVLQEQPKQGSLDIHLRPGIDFSTVATYFRAGLQIEKILPYNRNKWSVYLEPTYLGDKTTDFTFQIPAGVRYYLFLAKSAKLFISPIVLFKIERAKYSEITLFSGQFAAGAGFAYKRVSLEYRRSATGTNMAAVGFIIL